MKIHVYITIVVDSEVQFIPHQLVRLSALDIEPLKKRTRNYTPRAKSQKAKATKPKEIINLEDEEESTTKDVARVLDTLKRECETRGRIHYFKFLVGSTLFRSHRGEYVPLCFSLQGRKSWSDVGERWTTLCLHP